MNLSQLSAWMIQESVSKNMERLLDAWNKELEAAEKTSRELAKQIHAEKSKEAQQTARENYQENLVDAEASRLLHYVNGALNHAEANESISITIPSGVQVASQAIVATQVGELLEAIGDLRAEINDNDDQIINRAQYSAVWATAHGFVPHPRDIADLVRAYPQGEAWAQRFAEFSQNLKTAQHTENQPGRLQGYLAHKEIDTLRSHVQHLQALGTKALSKLISTKPSTALPLGAPPRFISKQDAANAGPTQIKSASLQTILNDFNRPTRK
ncbi:MAG: hypothetical protein VYC39_16575 [Myxococcota bacterium]|nr:hypothetical protein [Myxococcota bacterium]